MTCLWVPRSPTTIENPTDPTDVINIEKRLICI